MRRRGVGPEPHTRDSSASDDQGRVRDPVRDRRVWI